jgi:hypothetical protein
VTLRGRRHNSTYSSRTSKEPYTNTCRLCDNEDMWGWRMLGSLYWRQAENQCGSKTGVNIKTK